jgi:hypothetical protein
MDGNPSLGTGAWVRMRASTELKDRTGDLAGDGRGRGAGVYPVPSARGVSSTLS